MSCCSSMLMPARTGTFSVSRAQIIIQHIGVSSQTKVGLACRLPREKPQIPTSLRPRDLDCLDSTSSLRRTTIQGHMGLEDHRLKKPTTETPCFSRVERARSMCRSLAATIRETIGALSPEMVTPTRKSSKWRAWSCLCPCPCLCPYD